MIEETLDYRDQGRRDGDLHLLSRAHRPVTRCIIPDGCALGFRGSSKILARRLGTGRLYGLLPNLYYRAAAFTSMTRCARRRSAEHTALRGRPHQMTFR